AALDDGGFVVAWSASTYDAATANYDTDVWARRFDASGSPIGGEFRLHVPTPLREEDEPALAAMSNGGFVAAWIGTLRNDGTGYDIFARRFAADGTPIGNEIAVNTTTDGEQIMPAVVGLSDAAFIVAWTSQSVD